MKITITACDRHPAGEIIPAIETLCVSRLSDGKAQLHLALCPACLDEFWGRYTAPAPAASRNGHGMKATNVHKLSLPVLQAMEPGKQYTPIQFRRFTGPRWFIPIRAHCRESGLIDNVGKTARAARYVLSEKGLSLRSQSNQAAQVQP